MHAQPKQLTRLLAAILFIIFAFGEGCKKSGETPAAQGGPRIATGTAFNTPAPTITSAAPLKGDIYALVFINGTNFSTTPANNTVNFNGVAAIVKSATATQLSVLAPATATSGAITVTTAGGTATGPVFTYGKHTVYVLGQTASGFCYWKNGVRTDLPADANGLNGLVNSIAVSGKDVYVGGAATGLQPAYWKNAAPAVLLPSNSETGYVQSIFVSGATVYTAGQLYNPFNSSYILVNWQNSTLNYLPNEQGTPGVAGLLGGMSVSGGNIYICGNISTNSGNNRNAAYWVNGGTPTVLSNVTSASANSIFISGPDLYLAGAVSGIDQYWTNGTPTLLKPNPINRGVAPGRTLYVSGGNVYVLAQSNGSAKYWKNGRMIGLTSVEFNGSIGTCIDGVGNNLYIGGCFDGNSNWGYWINGQFITIPGATNVYDILII